MTNQLIGIGAAIAVAGLISLFTARRIEAQYSAPVKVVNSTSAPAITSVMDDPGRIPYRFTMGQVCPNTNPCNFLFPQVPAGHRLVVQQLAGRLLYASAPTSNYITFTDASGNFFFDSFNFTPSPAPLLFAVFNRQVKGIFDQFEQPSVSANIYGSNFVSQSLISLTGYMLDCTAAPCSAIVQNQ